MEPVYCPNGHPNRPGTRICAVCRALVAPSPPAAPPSRPAVSSPRSPAAPRPVALSTDPPGIDAAPPAAPSKRGRPWGWLLLLFLLLTGLTAAVLLALYPIIRTIGESPTPIAGINPIVIEPTTLPLSTAPTGPTVTLEPSPTVAIGDSSPTLVSTITPLPIIVGVIITPTFSAAPGVTLIQNGDFADDWVNGWAREASGEGIVEVRPLDAEPGARVLHMEKMGAGALQVSQRIVLTTPAEELVFRARIRQMGTWDETVGVEGRSALVLRYEDANGDPLGASVWIDGSIGTTGLWGHAPLPPFESTLAPRFLPPDWQTIEIDLSNELFEQLPAIDPTEVRQITILFLLLGSDDCSPAACEAAMDAAGLSLAAKAP